MSSIISRRHLLLVSLPFLALLFGFGLAGGASANPGPVATTPNAAPDSPSTADAYMELRPRAGGPSNGGTVNPGTKFTLDFIVHAGSNHDLTVQQSFLTFNNAVLQVVDPNGTTCNPVNTITPDTSVFDAALQNELCNGPRPCTIRDQPHDPGYLAYASGALANCPQGCPNPEFRVASVTFCASNGGSGTIHWNFSPPDPANMDSQILNAAGMVQNRSLYHDYVVNVTGATATPGPPTSTRTPTRVPPASTATRVPTRPAGGCQMNFTDVKQGDPFYDAISSMYCRTPRVISGYSDNTFRPYDTTLRSQIAKMIVLSFQLPINAAGGPHFTDVPQGTEMYNYIETAYNKGIITGFDNRLFKPWDAVKRGQIAKMIVKGGNIQINTAGGPHFKDVPKTDPFYDYIETAKAHNMITGFDDGTFRTYDIAKRGQIAKIIDGALDSR